MSHPFVSTTHCSDCRKSYDAERYQRLKNKRQEQNRAWRKRLRQELFKLKNKPCSICNAYYPNEPELMHWHHLDPSTKLDDVSNMIGRAPKEKILQEIEKCIPVCVLCHTRITYGYIDVGEAVLGSAPDLDSGYLVGSNPTARTR